MAQAHGEHGDPYGGQLRFAGSLGEHNARQPLFERPRDLWGQGPSGGWCERRLADPRAKVAPPRWDSENTFWLSPHHRRTAANHEPEKAPGAGLLSPGHSALGHNSRVALTSSRPGTELTRATRAAPRCSMPRDGDTARQTKHAPSAETTPRCCFGN